eukprot:g1175.t1
MYEHKCWQEDNNAVCKMSRSLMLLIYSVCVLGVALFMTSLIGKTFLGSSLDMIEDYMNRELFPPKVSKWALEGNFAPIREERSIKKILPIFGEIPSDIRGTFLRVGPNPLFHPKGGYHWFDGDGMVHAVKFKKKGVEYTNNYIETPRYRFEKEQGRPMFLKLGDMQGIGGIIKILVLNQLRQWFGIVPDRSLRDGTANTNIVFWNDRLLSLVESALPFALRVNEDTVGVDSIGYDDFDGQIDFPVIAHPKVDRKTGEFIAVGYILRDGKPDAKHAVISPNGTKVSEFPISFRSKLMLHDIAITEHFTIIPEWSLVFDPKNMVNEDSGGQVFTMNYSQNARFHLFPRHAMSQSEGRVYDLELPGFGFHVMNAWETSNGAIQLFACMQRNFTMSFGSENGEDVSGPISLHRWTLYPSGKIERATIYDRHNIEFVRVRDDRFGYETAFGYGAIQNRSTANIGGPEFMGLVKIDLTTGTTAGEIFFGPGRTSGEFVFVPPDDEGAAEDADDRGYLMGFVFDSPLGQSELVIYDAKSFSPVPLARLLIPQRVPFGFHATWVGRAEEEAMSEA